MALLKEAIEYSKEKFDPQNLIIYGYVQEGNLASETTCARANGSLTGKYLSVNPTRTISGSKPKTASSTIIREANKNDYSTIAENINHFYAGYNFYEYQSEASLSRWLAPKEIEGQHYTFTRYYLALDRQGTPQAGIGVFHGTSLYDLEIIKMPAVVKFLNAILKVIPPDNLLGALPVSRFWYNPGQLEAGKELWHEVRKLESNQGKLLLANFDPDGQLSPILVKRRLIPTSKIQLVIFHNSDIVGSLTGRLASYEI
jgi:hypothetical protein